MNIFNLLTKEKSVAGIEISDSVVRIAFLRKHTDKHGENTAESLTLIEEPIAANIIEDGVVVDPALLGKTLKGIWSKANLGTDYAIVAIPDDKVYARTFSFPKTVEGARLTEAMSLAIGFQLPFDTKDTYLDWERTRGTTTMNEILLETIPRTVVQGYVSAFEAAGIKALALESHLAAIARAIKTEPGRTTIFTEKTPDGATVFILKDGILRFSRTLPARFVDEQKVPAEVANIKTAYEAESGGTILEGDLSRASIRDDHASHPELTQKTPTAKWLIALGAAIRGQIPEGEDNLISLLPVGTEEAYAYQKATTFIALIRNMTVGVAIFFVLAFVAAYLFMLSLSQNANKTVATLSVSSASSELLAQEDHINRVNALTMATGAILAQTPRWSVVLDEVTARITPGISIITFSAPSITDKMGLAGAASDRLALNQFKKSLQESAMFTEVDLPLTNLEQESDIPFSIQFRIKDPSALYFK